MAGRHPGGRGLRREMTIEVIDLADTFELNSMLRELEELWPRRAEHLDRVEEILEYLEDKVHELVTGSPELLDADQRAAWVKLRARQLATVQAGFG
jgi:transposase